MKKFFEYLGYSIVWLFTMAFGIWFGTVWAGLTIHLTKFAWSAF